MSTRNKKVGIYGGTFDPIHFGHLNLALEMLELHKLDEVWFCPAQVNPHKVGTSPVDGAHRFKMLTLAIEENPYFKVLDLELYREGPSFMIDTLTALIEAEKGKPNPCEFSLIIGEDSLKGFTNWHRVEEIVKLVSLLVGSRTISYQDREKIEKENSMIWDAIQKGMTPTRKLEISSTEIRERIHRRLFIRYLVPWKVVDYIYANHLYFEVN